MVVCEYCGVETSLASPGAEAAAVALETLGLRLPERPMSTEELDDQVAERAARERERLLRIRLLAAVFFVVVLAVVGMLVALGA